MKLRFTIFGIEIWAIEFGNGPQWEIVDEGQEQSYDDIASGTSHNFERDLNPPDPSNEESWYEDRKRFGFS